LIAYRLPDLTSHPRHVRVRTTVLPELKVLYMPVPKAGCTSLLWLMAELGGRNEADFAHSLRPSVSPDMLVHDPKVWDPALQLSHYSAEQADAMWTDPEWFRFAVVREPASRLWSAWQSKLLLREPGFVRRFEESGWIPDVPTSADQIREAFSEFLSAVAAGGEDAPRDVHWTSQAGLVGDLPFSHVGRVTEMEKTLDLLRSHVGVDLPELPAANPSPLPFTPALLDDADREAMNDATAADRERFGYPAVAAPDDSASDFARWREKVEPLLPLVRELIRRHRRIDQLAQVAKDRTS
jgi:hypothetical protein